MVADLGDDIVEGITCKHRDARLVFSQIRAPWDGEGDADRACTLNTSL